MKKVLFFLMLSALAFITPTHSQIVLQSQKGNVSDTITASDTIYLRNVASLSGVGLTGKYAIELTFTALSGTVTATVTTEGSMIGGTGQVAASPWLYTGGWSTGINKVPGTNGRNCDTLIVTAAGVYYLTIAPSAIHQLTSAAGVEQTYYTSNPTRRYYIRLKILSGVAAQSTKVSARLITQD